MKNKKNLILLLLGIAIVSLSAYRFLQRSPVSQESNYVTPTKELKEESLAAQASDEGEVAVEVTPLELAAGKKPKFKIIFSTHSVDLLFDVEESVSLVDSSDNVYKEVLWEGSEPGGHHRSGELTFQETLKETGSVELIVTDVAGIKERKFSWKL